MSKTVVIEDGNETGTTWLLSFDGPNPAPDKCVRCADRAEAFKLQTIVDQRDMAWARLVRAATADMDSLHVCADDPTEENTRDHVAKNEKYWAAVNALRELGVDVDALLTAAQAETAKGAGR